MIIHANETYIILNYGLAIIFAIVVGLIVKLPLLPERPMRDSWTLSAVFPTAIIALGLSAIIFKMVIFDLYLGMVVAIIIGIFSALFTKFLFDHIFPKPGGGIK
ncbi:MAG: energy-converting hydrogenase A subunit A EhaA [Methanobacteriaceae archaeon]|nr:energy-converting hydrogenase A subunit A EhaA [Methanobacteriaceae archaeon]